MVKAGIMLDGAGLQSSAKGARIRFDGGKRSVIDGPFAETKELIAGYWIIQVKSKAEAIEWMKRCPNPYNEDGEIEIRQFFELEDFGESPAIDHHKAVGEQTGGAEKIAAIARQISTHHPEKEQAMQTQIYLFFDGRTR